MLFILIFSDNPWSLAVIFCNHLEWPLLVIADYIIRKQPLKLNSDKYIQETVSPGWIGRKLVEYQTQDRVLRLNADCWLELEIFSSPFRNWIIEKADGFMAMVHLNRQKAQKLGTLFTKREEDRPWTWSNPIFNHQHQCVALIATRDKSTSIEYLCS